jgi:hypothetical protein
MGEMRNAYKMLVGKPEGKKTIDHSEDISVDGSIRCCIQKFPDWPPGARIANGKSFCH